VQLRLQCAARFLLHSDPRKATESGILPSVEAPREAEPAMVLFFAGLEIFSNQPQMLRVDNLPHERLVDPRSPKIDFRVRARFASA
jgi:hypothetical protein